jgi:hypothetical protein
MRVRTTAILLGFSIVAVAMAGRMAPAGGAESNKVKLGHLAPPDTGGCSNCNEFQLSTDPASPSYRVPKGRWTIVKWRTRGGGAEDGSARLRVWRETSTDGKYKLVGQSHEKTIGADDAPSFQANIKVKKGDLLGLLAVSGLAGGYLTVNPDDVAGGAACFAGGVGDSVGTNTSCAVDPLDHSLANVTATLKRR